MTTIAQISATFIAITAGFYTTKIISIINDKSRIKGRSRELDAELIQVNKNYDNLQKQIDAIDSKNKEKWKASLREVFMHRIEFEAINTLNDLGSVFERRFESKPDEIGFIVLDFFFEPSLL